MHIEHNKAEIKIKKLTPKLKLDMSKCKIFLALIIRLLLVGECALSLFLTLCIMDTYLYLSLVTHMVVILFDGLYCSIKNKGQDYKWYVKRNIEFVFPKF